MSNTYMSATESTPHGLKQDISPERLLVGSPDRRVRCPHPRCGEGVRRLWRGLDPADASPHRRGRSWCPPRFRRATHGGYAKPDLFPISPATRLSRPPRSRRQLTASPGVRARHALCRRADRFRRADAHLPSRGCGAARIRPRRHNPGSQTPGLVHSPRVDDCRKKS